MSFDGAPRARTGVADGVSASGHPFLGTFQRARDWGWRRALMAALMHCAVRLGVNLHYVFIGSNHPARDDEPVPEIPPGYVVKIGTKADFLPFVGKVEDLDAEFVEQAFARHDESSLVLYEGELVAFSFNTYERARVTPQLDILVPDGVRYGYKAWTHPDHRRRHLSKY